MEVYEPFLVAQPVWLAGMENEMNVTGGWVASMDGAGKATLRVATSGFFRVFVNGRFVHYGPARCAYGFFRVDEIPLALEAGVNHIAVEAVCYGVNSFSSLMQAPFIQAEIVADGAAIAATGAQGFAAYRLTQRVQKIQRYSYQRTFAECYQMEKDVNDWRVGRPGKNAIEAACVRTQTRTLWPRRLARPSFPKAPAVRRVATGTFESGVRPEAYWRDRSLVSIGDPRTGALGGFTQDELALHLTDELCELRTRTLEKENTPYAGSSVLEAGAFEILALPCEKTGLLGARIRCTRAGELLLMVDETLRTTGDVDPLSMGCVNAIRLDMQEGAADFQSAEPLGWQYIKIACVSGAFTVEDVHLREVICPQPVTAQCASDDPALRKIFDAARETFLQNSFDLFMDCPTRERAGWLCDSFFTARAEYFFTGASGVERNFLENFLLPSHFDALPAGMVPMCYPSDVLNGQFIPNWAMWLILELEEYRARSGDTALVAAFEGRIRALLSYLETYENAEGLLEKLPNWVFVEWSHANELVQDINFPSNMLYARALQAASALYGDAALLEKAKRLQAVIRARSFDGTFFRDNEVYRDGKPVSTGERTETCQYYAFFMGTATPESHPVLWETLTRDFGPKRAARGLYPEIWPANAFIGNYLRLDLLRRYGRYGQLRAEMTDYFLYMAERTGTLWENTTDYASCNHGFASYAAVLLDAAVRGQ